MICIYHSRCADGFTAAWVVRKACGDALPPDSQFFGAAHGEPPPDVTGQHVIMVDFTYQRPVMEQIIRDCKSLVVLDHHKTAQEDLAGIDTAPRVMVRFDMERSGARLAWDYYFCYEKDESVPQLLLHIEDRDLWQFALPNTREITQAVFSRPYTFEAWDELFDTPCELLALEGTAIERYASKNMGELIKSNTRKMLIGGHCVPVANIPYFMASDAGNVLCHGYPFAACYSDQADKRVFSLRSCDTGMDVSEIAKQYGGGGHRNAAGFSIQIGWEGETEGV